MMDDLHNKAIDVLKCMIRARKEYPNMDSTIDNIVNVYFNFSDHKEFINEIGIKITREFKLGAAMAGGIIDLDDIKTAEFLKQYETDEYILNRCFDELEKEDGTYRLFSYLIDQQRIKIEPHRQKVLEASLKESKLVESKSTGYNDSYLLNPKGILGLSKYGSYSNYVTNLLQLIKENETQTIPLIVDHTYASVLDFKTIIDFLEKAIDSDLIKMNDRNILVLGFEDETFIRTKDLDTKLYLDILCEEMYFEKIDIEKWNDTMSQRKIPDNYYGDLRFARFKVGF